MQKLHPNVNDINKRLDNYLCKVFSQYPKTMIFKWIRKGVVRVNQEKKNINYRLMANDEITINKNLNPTNKDNKYENLKNLKTKLNIIYEDENIVLINKPIGILSQDDNQMQLLTIQNMFLNYLITKKEFNPSTENSFTPSICNRLDRNTSGIIIAAKNAISLKEMNELIKNHQIDKYYLAMVFGSLKKPHDELIAYHYKDTNKNIVNISSTPKPKYKKIITKYKVLQSNQKYSILEVQLITGKTHQIRAHLNHIGHPIVGDNKYKQKNTNTDARLSTQALISYKIKINIQKGHHLSYLNNQTFAIKDDIWFLQYY